MAQGDLFELYFRFVKETEPPVIFHRWSLIAALGAYLARDCWIPFGSSRIFPNQYVMLVGNPGSRKSSAIKGVRKVLSQCGYVSFAAEKTSKEKYLVDLQGEKDDNATQPIINLFGGSVSSSECRQSFIVADEFNEFVGSGNLEFLSLLGALWDWDDTDTPFRSRTKTSKSVEIYQPTISILSGNTHAGFAEAFPVSVLGQGFMSRLILVYSEPSGRKITIPPIPDAALFSELIAEFGRIRESCTGPLNISDRAKSALDSVYKTWADLEDSRFKHYSTRRFTHLLKLCMICCAIAKRTEILVEDVLFANTLLTFTEKDMPKAMGEMGLKRSTVAASTIMSMLYETKKALTITDFWKQLDKDLEHLSDLTRLLGNLQQAGKIQIFKDRDGKQGFLAMQKPMNAHAIFVDFNLLKNQEMK